MLMIDIKIKLKEIWRNYQLIISVVLASIVISLLLVTFYKFFFKPKIKLEQFSNSIYTIQYDSTWDLVKKENELALLKNNDATINIEITTLTNDYLYMTLENIVDEISYSVLQNNSDYYLIGKQKLLVTSNQYDGYQLLYENGTSEVLLTLFKREDKIVSIVYEASYDDFDILLDSVKEIIYNFNLNSTEYDISYELAEIGTETLLIDNNNEVEVSSVKKHFIADSHYLVEFEVPEKFVSKTFNSRNAYLNYQGLDTGNISLTAYIYDYNLYEILEKLKNRSFDYSIKSAATNKKIKTETYTNIDDQQFIYHIEYEDNGNDYDSVYLVYELDYRRTFVIGITALECSLSNDIIDNITVTGKTKYANYVYRNIDNNNLINELKYAYTDYSDYQRKYDQIVLHTPLTYQEEDDEFSNVYELRVFNKDYNEESGEYDFKVKYSINSLSIENNINRLESVYYNSKNRKKIGVKTYNDKKFEVYTYNNKDSEVYVLFYKLESGNYLQIVIESKRKNIKDSTIKELTKFDEKNYLMN